MTSRRMEQVGDLIRAELSELLRREVRDPRLGFVTITEVTVSADLRNARVNASCYGDAAAQEESLRALRSAAGFLRTAVGKRVRLRTIPHFTFQIDRSMEQAEEIQRTLHTLAPEFAAAAAREAEERAQAEREGAE
jgi:ribosome-binding factor A